jgi:hypothetical protein
MRREAGIIVSGVSKSSLSGIAVRDWESTDAGIFIPSASWSYDKSVSTSHFSSLILNLHRSRIYGRKCRKLAGLARLERATIDLEGRCSIH